MGLPPMGVYLRASVSGAPTELLVAEVAGWLIPPGSKDVGVRPLGGQSQVNQSGPNSIYGGFHSCRLSLDVSN